MKNKILTIGLLFAVMAAVTGIAAANPCPDLSGVLSAAKKTSMVNMWATGDNMVRDYYVTTTFSPGDIKEYCIYPNNPGSTLETDPIVVFDDVSNWKFSTLPGGNPVQIKMTSDKGNYPIDSPVSNFHVATITYSGDELPSPENLIALHVRSNDLCPGVENDADKDGDPNTCFVIRDPGTGVPEFPTVALPIAAVIGLVLFFQHKKKKNLK